MDDDFTTAEEPQKRRAGGSLHRGGLVLAHIVEHFFNNCLLSMRIIVRESDLFFGLGLFLVGLLNFESGKYCDGNTADYLACTRPATYYYFDLLDIVLIFIGSALILAWFLKQRR